VGARAILDDYADFLAVFLRSPYTTSPLVGKTACLHL